MHNKLDKENRTSMNEKDLPDYKNDFLWEIRFATQRGFRDQNCPGREWKAGAYLCACSDTFLEPASVSF